MLGKYFFIINPGSNHKRSEKPIRVLKKELNEQNIEYESKETTSLEDAYNFSRNANIKGYEIIVAVGGDGTINKVINGFFDENGKRISSSKLGVIHTGTSPDFCKSYGIPTNPTLALNLILENYSKNISVAKIEYQNENRERQVGYFACCASLGLGAEVAKNANSGIRKYLGDSIGTFVSIIKSLFRYKAADLKISCDKNEYVVEKNFNTFVGKTSFIASGMKVNHTLSAADNRLYVLSLKKINLLNVVPALKSIYSDKAIKSNNFISFNYAKSIEVYANKENPEIEFDGDPQGFLPCKISIAEEKLEIIVKENGF